MCLPGFCLPDDYFTPMVRETVQKLMSVLRDPNLPLLELLVRNRVRERERERFVIC